MPSYGVGMWTEIFFKVFWVCFFVLVWGLFVCFCLLVCLFVIYTANTFMSKCVMLRSASNSTCTSTLVAVILLTFYFSDKLLV